MITRVKEKIANANGDAFDFSECKHSQFYISERYFSISHFRMACVRPGLSRGLAGDAAHNSWRQKQITQADGCAGRRAGGRATRRPAPGRAAHGPGQAAYRAR